MAREAIFDWWSVIIILGIAQGIVASLALFFNYRKRPAVVLLGLLVLVLVWHHLQSISIYLNFFDTFPHFYGADLGSLFLIGPLFYLYTEKITSEHSSLLKKWDWIHFTPFIITIIAHPVLFLPAVEKVGLIRDWLVATRYDNPHLRQAFLLDDIIFTMESLHMIVYFILSVLLLRKYARQLKEFISNDHHSHFQWLATISISLIIVIIGSFILQKILYVQLKYYYYSLDYIYILPMTLFIYFTGFYVLKSPALFSVKPDFRKLSSKYAGSSLTAEDAEKFQQQLTEYLSKEKPYLNANLSLPELAENLAIPPNHLSQVINEKFNLNFFDLINRYRIEEVKRRFENDRFKNDKLLKIALESGFNNKVSFNNYFKKITGKTPSVYREKF